MHLAVCLRKWTSTVDLSNSKGLDPKMIMLSPDVHFESTEFMGSHASSASVTGGLKQGYLLKLSHHETRRHNLAIFAAQPQPLEMVLWNYYARVVHGHRMALYAMSLSL
jgi:hypothetical protein